MRTIRTSKPINLKHLRTCQLWTEVQGGDGGNVDAGIDSFQGSTFESLQDLIEEEKRTKRLQNWPQVSVY